MIQPSKKCQECQVLPSSTRIERHFQDMHRQTSHLHIISKDYWGIHIHVDKCQVGHMLILPIYGYKID